MPFRWRSRATAIWPSVMYPVRSAIGWVQSSSGIDMIGICVMLPFFPWIRPALSYIVARSVYV